MSLTVFLERPLPPSWPVGSACAIFIHGACFDPEASVTDLRLRAGGTTRPVTALNMPRPDLVAADLAPLQSGFWGILVVPEMSEPGHIPLQLLAWLDDGREEMADLGSISIVPHRSACGLPATPESPQRPLIAIAMATFEPDLELFRAQLDSLRSQTDDGWVCIISDDGSGPEHFEQIRVEVAGDPRFALSRSDERLGFYRNFERAISLVPPQAELIALCDQDDRWQPDKLATLRAAIGSASLAYSDLRLVSDDGLVLRPTLWEGRSNNPDDLTSMLVANTITGAAMLFTREVADAAIPFPDVPGYQYHDHWLALVALAVGDLAYVDRPLYDYVQHPGAVFGDVTHGPPAADGRAPRWRAILRPVRGPLEPWRAGYFYGYVSRCVQAETLLARCGPRLSAHKRLALVRFLQAERSPLAFLRLLARSLRRFFGHTETLGSEIELAEGIVWKSQATARARVRFAPPRLLGDGSVPPLDSFSQKRLRRWRARI